MQFMRGKSGNPAGRPRGSQSHQKVRQAILEAAPEIVQVMIEAAKSGDTRAARVLLERALPPLKAEVASVELDAPVELSGRVKAIADAMLRGAISATQAGEMLAALLLASRAAPEAADGTRALWVVPPQLSIEEWQRVAQAMVRP